MTAKIFGALAAAAAVLAAGVVTEAQGPIRVGASLSLTGTYAKLGKNQHEGGRSESAEDFCRHGKTSCAR